MKKSIENADLLALPNLGSNHNLSSQQLALRQDTDARLRRDRWSGLSGSLTVALAFVGVAWSYVPSIPLLLWWLGNAALVGGVFCCQSGWLLPHWRDRYQAPKFLMILYWGRGIWFGAMPLLNWSAFQDAEYFWITLAFFACFIAGQMVLNTIFVVHLLTPLFIMITALILLKQAWLIGLGFLVLLFVTVRGACKIQRTRINEVLLRIRLQHQAYQDELTGIFNRAGLEATSANMPGMMQSAIFIDLDKFKDVNDQLGHEAGDHLLKQVAERLTSLSDSIGGILARFGGDEFFMLSQSTDVYQLTQLAEAIIRTVEHPFYLPMGKAKISASVGITVNHQEHITLKDAVTLQQLGLPLAQGFFYAKPMPLDQIATYADTFNSQQFQNSCGFHPRLTYT